MGGSEKQLRQPARGADVRGRHLYTFADLKLAGVRQTDIGRIVRMRGCHGLAHGKPVEFAVHNPYDSALVGAVEFTVSRAY